VGGAFVAGDGGPERVVRIVGAEGRQRMGESGGSRAGEAGKRVHGFVSNQGYGEREWLAKISATLSSGSKLITNIAALITVLGCGTLGGIALALWRRLRRKRRKVAGPAADTATPNNMRSNSGNMRKAATARSAAAKARAEKGLEHMILNGQQITFRGLARVADVSPATLYRHPDIRRQVEELRAQQQKGSAPSKPPSGSQSAE
jgi:Family of unknown function (DUF6262)